MKWEEIDLKDNAESMFGQSVIDKNVDRRLEK